MTRFIQFLAHYLRHKIDFTCCTLADFSNDNDVRVINSYPVKGVNI